MQTRIKILIVTSQTTFVKDNYYSFLQTLTDTKILPSQVEICGLVLIKNADFKLILKSLYLFFHGCVFISSVLLKNMFTGIFLDRRAALMRARSIPVIKISDINSPVSIRLIKKLEPSLIVNARTRSIYKKELLDLPKLGCVNVHHGLLPQQKGTMCDLWALYKKQPAGFTIHRMDERIDNGEIIIKKVIAYQGIKKYIDLPQNSSLIEAETLIEYFKTLPEDKTDVTESNNDGKIKYFKNPSLKTIRKMIKAGIRL